MSARPAAGPATGLLEEAGALPFRVEALRRYRAIAPLGTVARDPAARIGYTSMRGYYWSLLMGVRYPHESLLERDAMLVHDLDPTVEAMWAQPQTHRLRLAGRSTRYTPDLRVRLFGGFEVELEMKRSEKIAALDQAVRDRMAAACATAGRPHAFLDEVAIRAEPSWSNSVSARAAAAHLTDHALLDAGAALASVDLPIRLGQLLLAMSGTTRLQTVLGLVALRILSLPLAEEITGATMVGRGTSW